MSLHDAHTFTKTMASHASVSCAKHRKSLTEGDVATSTLSANKSHRGRLFWGLETCCACTKAPFTGVAILVELANLLEC